MSRRHSLRVLIGLIVTLALAIGSMAVPPSMAASGGDYAAAASLQPPEPVAPDVIRPEGDRDTSVTTATWATGIWIGVGIVFLVLLVGGVLFAARRQRPAGG